MHRLRAAIFSFRIIISVRKRRNDPFWGHHILFHYAKDADHDEKSHLS